MANSRIERRISVTKSREAKTIEYVQAASAVPIWLGIVDFTIPAGATARVYVVKPSGTAEYDECLIEDNGILIDVKTTMFDEIGTYTMQAEVLMGDETLITFVQTAEVSETIIPGEVPAKSENKSNFLDEYIEKLDARQVTAESQVKESAELLEKVQAEQTATKEYAEKATTASTAAAASATAAATSETNAKASATEAASYVTAAAQSASAASTSATNAATSAANAQAAEVGAKASAESAASTLKEINEKISFDESGNVTFSGKVSAADPTQAGDLATKWYIDKAIQEQITEVENGAY